jgi:hypothetical protein
MNGQTRQWLKKKFWTAHRPTVLCISSSSTKVTMHFAFFILGNQRTSFIWHETTWLEPVSTVCMPPDTCQYVCFVLLCWVFLFVIYFWCSAAFSVCCIWSVLNSQSCNTHQVLYIYILYIYITANAKISLPQSAAIVYLCILYWEDVCMLLIVLLM